MDKAITRFLVRWLVCSLGLWIASGLLGSINYEHSGVVVVAGLVLALINSFIKPLIIVFSLPAIVFSLGLFMIVVNGLTVWLACKIYTPLHIGNFWAAILAGMIIGLVNYLVTTILEERD